MSKLDDKNIQRRCKNCNEFYFLHPNVWKIDKSGLLPLEYKFVQGEQYIAHVCHNKPTETKYNFEEERIPNPDEVYKNLKPTKNNNNNISSRPRSNNVSEHVGVTKQFLKDMEEMKQEVSEIKMLLTAVIKIFDVATRKSNKSGDSLLFQKASNMVDEEEKRTTIEETKKVHTETDDVDDDDGNVPSETTETVEEEEVKKEEE